MCNISEIGVYSRREQVVLDVCGYCSVVCLSHENLICFDWCFSCFWFFIFCVLYVFRV